MFRLSSNSQTKSASPCCLETPENATLKSKALSTLDLLIAIRSRANERPHCTLKTILQLHFRYHVTDDQCVRVGSLLVESIDTATQGERRVSGDGSTSGAAIHTASGTRLRVAYVQVTPTIFNWIQSKPPRLVPGPPPRARSTCFGTCFLFHLP